MQDSNKIEQEIKSLNTNLVHLDKKLEKVMFILVGEDLAKEGGIAARVIDLEEKVEKLERMIEKTKFFFMGATVFGGYGVFEFVKNILANLK